MTGAAILNWYFADLETPAIRFDLGLKKRAARTNAFVEHMLQSRAREQLKSSGHVLKRSSQQRIAHNRSAPADQIPAQRTFLNAATATKAAAENAVIAFLHPGEELRNIGWQVAKAGIDLQHPITTGRQRCAISNHVSIDDTLVLGRPHDPQITQARGEIIENITRLVRALSIEDRKEGDRLETLLTAFLQHLAHKRRSRNLFIGHRTDDPEIDVGKLRRHGHRSSSFGFHLRLKNQRNTARLQAVSERD